MMRKMRRKISGILLRYMQCGSGRYKRITSLGDDGVAPPLHYGARRTKQATTKAE
jgi:hypothetical protein